MRPAEEIKADALKPIQVIEELFTFRNLLKVL